MMPRGEWVYVKGESQVQCDGEDPYYADLEWAQVTIEDGADKGVVLSDSHLRQLDCAPGFVFYDGRNAVPVSSQCGSRVSSASQSWLQLVSPRVVYLRQSYEAINPYDEFDPIKCRVFETGYLRPFVDVVEWVSDTPDLGEGSDL
jgi:hypothetical protein